MSPTYRFPVWDHLARFARRTAPEGTPEERLAAWLQCETSLRELFSSHIGEQSAQERFVVPSDYVNFMIQIGGGWEWNDEWEELLSLVDVAESTAWDYRMWIIQGQYRWWGVGRETNPQDFGLWLNIGRYGDKHEQSLCCDRQHPLFGCVTDCHDTHPWCGGATLADVIGVSFSEYLEFLTSRVERTALI